MASHWWTVVYVQALLVCGSLNTITMKILGRSWLQGLSAEHIRSVLLCAVRVAFTMSGTADGRQERFEKPWLMTFIMPVICTKGKIEFSGSVWLGAGSLRFVSMTLALPFDAGRRSIGERQHDRPALLRVPAL